MILDKSILNTLFVFLLLTQIVKSDLTFVKDSQLKKFGSKSISYTLAPYGKFPYGRELFGKLSYEHNSGCSPFKLNNNSSNSDIPHMLILNSNECNIKLQSLNAENAGAKFLIIVKSENESEDEMVNKSLGSNHINVNIPTVIVQKNVGSKLMDLINETGELYLKFSMPLPKHDRVDFDAYIVKSDKQFWKFLIGFKNYALQFQEKLNLKIHIFAENDKDQDAKLELNFICFEKEQLFEILPLFYDNCVLKNNINDQCLTNEVKAFDKTFMHSFTQCKSINSKSLSKMKENQKDLTVEKSSFIQLNKSIYHGSLKPVNVFEAVCGGFVYSPGNCLFLNNKYVLNTNFHNIINQKKKHKTLLILASLMLTLLLLVIVGFLLCLIYNKIYQRTLKEKVSDMVRDSVVQYQSMKDNV